MSGTVCGGDLVGDGGQVLRKVVMEFGGEARPFADAQFGLELGDLFAEELPALSGDEQAQDPVSVDIDRMDGAKLLTAVAAYALTIVVDRRFVFSVCEIDGLSFYRTVFNADSAADALCRINCRTAVASGYP